MSRESAGMRWDERRRVSSSAPASAPDSSIADRRLVVPRDGDLSPDSRAIVIRVSAAVEPESLVHHGVHAPSLACHFNRAYKRRSPVLAHRLPAVAAVLI